MPGYGLKILTFLILSISSLFLLTTTASAAVNPAITTSSLTTASQPSTEQHMVRTSDGTLHAFINTGTQTTSCSGTPAGLTWFDSTDSGATWTCGANLNTSVGLFASATVDSSDNIYVTYSVATTGASASNDVFYRKLTKGSGASWTVGTERTVLDAGASVGYSYAVIEKENTNSRLWLAVRYFDATNYQVPVYYSSDLTDNPTWTQSSTNLDTAGTQSAAHFPAIVKFGSKMGVVYTNNSQALQWRFRADADGLSNWVAENPIPELSTMSTATFSVIGTSAGTAYVAQNQGTSIGLTYFNGNVWGPVGTVSGTASNNTFVSVSTDGTNAWVMYSDTTGLSGVLSGSKKLVYKKCVPPFGAVNCDPNPTNINTYQDTLEKVWVYNGTTYQDVTTAAANTTNTDVFHSSSGGIVKAIGDIGYFGKTSQFDALSWVLGNNGNSTGVVTWEYCSAVNGSSVCTTWSTLTITSQTSAAATKLQANGYLAYTAPSDWVAAKVNSESTAYYYLRARATTAFTTSAPAGTQLAAIPLIGWADFLPGPASSTIYGLWTENAVSPMRVKAGSISVTTGNNSASSSDLNPVSAYSSVTTATQPSTERHMVRTSDGTLHEFIQSGTSLACGSSTSTNNQPGLNWLYSTDSGSTWTCGGNFSSDTTNLMYASATTDSSDNIYITYSQVVTTGGATKNVYYRKLTKGSGATWGISAEQTVLSGSASVGYAYAVIEKETTNNRLWLAMRYFDGTNYQVPVYYSSDLSDTPTWTQSSATLDTAGTTSTAHFPTIVKFGSKIGVIYTNNSSAMQWRFRADSDGLTNWTPESVVPELGTFSTVTFSAVGTSAGYVYVVHNRPTSVGLSYFNGSTWSSAGTVSSTAASGAFVSLSTDGTNVWVFYGDTTNLSGSLSGSRKLVYKKCVPPYGAGNCDSAVNVNSSQDVFDKVWTNISSSFSDVTTAAGNSTSADVTMPSIAGDAIYFGKTGQFDAISYDVSSASVGGVLTWEYWNGSAWISLTNFSAVSNPSFNGDGYIAFTPNSDWAKTTVNGEGTSYYYVRARLLTSYQTTPVSVQFDSIPLISWANVLPNPIAGTIYVNSTENAASPNRIRNTTVSVSGSTNSAASADIPPSVIGYGGFTQPSSARNLVKTTDGTLHAFVQSGTSLACGGSTSTNNQTGLNWIYSTDNGNTWICGGQLSSSTTMAASATVDSSDNIYIVYSVATTGASSSFDVVYRKLTYNGSSSWTLGGAQTVFDASSSTGYSFAVVEKEKTNNRLWLTARYFDGTNYQVVVDYSSDLSDTPTWNVSQATLDTAGTANGQHKSAIVQFGSKIGIFYSTESNTITWRYRADTDGVTAWSDPVVISAHNASSSTTRFVGVGTDSGKIYFAHGGANSGASKWLYYYDGSSWGAEVNITSTSNNGFVGLSADENALYVSYIENSDARLIYRKCIAPFNNINNCDVADTSVVSYHNIFDKVWSYVSGSYTNVTSPAGDTTAADTQMVSSTNDILYFGKTAKFDDITWTLSTNGIAGVVAWEYWNGSSWVTLNNTIANTNTGFAGSGALNFTPNTDWATTTVNGESTSYYYIRARVTTSFTTIPIGTLLNAVPANTGWTMLKNPVSASVYTMWNDASSRVRLSLSSTTTSSFIPSSGYSFSSGNGVSDQSADSNWWNYSYTWRDQLTFNNTQSNLGVSPENLTNFPVLVKLTSSNFDFNKAKSDGSDIRFIDSDNKTALPYEIEKWDQSNKEAEVWVNVPQIDANSNSDSIYMYYGNPGASDGQSKNAVWNSNYAAVYHLGETSGILDYDSTSNNNYGAKVSDTEPSPTTSGQIDGAQTFDGVNDYVNGTVPTTGDTSFTASVWVKTTQPVVTLLVQGANGNFGVYIGKFTIGKALAFFDGTTSNNDSSNTSTTFVNDGNWHQIVGTNDGTTTKLYVDGRLENTYPETITVGTSNPGNIWIGSNSGTQQFYSGIMDEMELSKTAFSPAWIAASYKAGLDQFINHSSQSTPPAGQTLTASNSIGSGDNGKLRFNGSISSGGNSSFMITNVECSTNGGGFNGATASDGAFDEQTEDFYYDFLKTNNNWTGDGYTIQCRATRSGGTVIDNLFYFTPFNLVSPTDKFTTTDSYPSFTFSLVKQKDQLKNNISKYQILVQKVGSDQWSTYVDNIPADKEDSVSETDDFRYTVADSGSKITVQSKTNPLSGIYNWKAVATDRSGHTIETDSRLIFANTKATDSQALVDPDFPLAILSITGLGNPNISSTNLKAIKTSYSTSSINPTFYGIAFSNSEITLSLINQACLSSLTPSCIKTYTTTANDQSRFQINIPKGDLKSNTKYLTQLSVAKDDQSTQLPSFTLSIAGGGSSNLQSKTTTTTPAPPIRIKINLSPTPTPKSTPKPQLKKNCLLFFCF